MTCDEFSNEFDFLLNSYSKLIKYKENLIPGSIELDEYEKSIVLTQAQEELVQDYYSGKNIFNQGFESTEQIRRHLDELIQSHTADTIIDNSTNRLDPNSVIFSIPKSVLYIVYESATLVDSALGCKSGCTVPVRPVKYDNYLITQRNPFRKANSNRVFRVDLRTINTGGLTFKVVELISQYTIGTYFLRYITQPQPIILVNLNDLTINGVSSKTECELNPGLHRSILQRAVQIALARFNVSGN